MLFDFSSAPFPTIVLWRLVVGGIQFCIRCRGFEHPSHAYSHSFPIWNYWWHLWFFLYGWSNTSCAGKCPWPTLDLSSGSTPAFTNAGPLFSTPSIFLSLQFIFLVFQRMSFEPAETKFWGVSDSDDVYTKLSVVAFGWWYQNYLSVRLWDWVPCTCLWWSSTMVASIRSRNSFYFLFFLFWDWIGIHDYQMQFLNPIGLSEPTTSQTEWIGLISFIRFIPPARASLPWRHGISGILKWNILVGAPVILSITSN